MSSLDEMDLIVVHIVPDEENEEHATLHVHGPTDVVEALALMVAVTIAAGADDLKGVDFEDAPEVDVEAA